MGTLIEVDFRSAHGPSVAASWDGVSADPSPAADGPASGGLLGWLGAWLRPQLRVATPFGAKTIAPYGPAPSSSSWPLVPLVFGGVLLLVVVLAVVGVVALIRAK